MEATNILDEELNPLIQIPTMPSASCTTSSNLSNFSDISSLLWKKNSPTSEGNMRCKYGQLYQSTLPSNRMGNVSY